MTTDRRRSRGAEATAREPGPQKRIRRTYVGSILLGSLIILVAATALLALLQANAPSVLSDDLKKLRILSTDNALTLFVALLSIVALRQQYLATLQPYLTYSSYSELTPEDAPRTWTVELHNAGTGIAIVTRVEYKLTLTEGANEDITGYEQTVSRLAAAGLERKQYRLTRFSRGSIIGPEKSVLIFQIPETLRARIRALDLRLTFESRAGELYEKNIFCIPPAPAMEMPPTPPAGAVGQPAGDEA